MSIRASVLASLLQVSLVSVSNAQCTGFVLPDNAAEPVFYNQTTDNGVRVSPALTCSEGISDCTISPRAFNYYGGNDSNRCSLFSPTDCSDPQPSKPGCLLRASGSINAQGHHNISDSYFSAGTNLNATLNSWLYSLAADGIKNFTGGSANLILAASATTCLDSSQDSQCLEVGRSGFLNLSPSLTCATGRLSDCRDDATTLEGLTVDVCGVLLMPNASNTTLIPNALSKIVYVNATRVADLSDNPALDSSCPGPRQGANQTTNNDGPESNSQTQNPVEGIGSELRLSVTIGISYTAIAAMLLISWLQMT